MLITLSRCLEEIRNWLQNNFLKLNGSKTDLILICIVPTDRKADQISLVVNSSMVFPISQVGNLGVIFDPQLTFDAHIKHIHKTAFCHFKNILNITDSEKLIHTFIMARLDYCNTLFSKQATVVYIQNSATCVLSHTAPQEHITTGAFQLHWLPINAIGLILKF